MIILEKVMPILIILILCWVKWYLHLPADQTGQIIRLKVGPTLVLSIAMTRQ
jgi:hypothetical protein